MILPLLAGSLIAGCDREKQADGQAAAPQANISSGEARDVGAFKHIVDRTNAGKAAPAVSFTGPDDAPVTLASFRGKPLLVNLWATWCAPCLKEMPELSALHAMREQVEVVGLAYEDIGLEEMRAFLVEHPVAYPIVIVDPMDPPRDFATPRGLPITYLIAPDGKLARQFLGPVTAHELENAIEASGGKVR